MGLTIAWYLRTPAVHCHCQGNLGKPPVFLGPFLDKPISTPSLRRLERLLGMVLRGAFLSALEMHAIRDVMGAIGDAGSVPYHCFDYMQTMHTEI